MRRIALLLLVAGCSPKEAPAPAKPTEEAASAKKPAEEKVAPATLTLYAGRSLSLVKPLLTEFKKQTGIQVVARDGKSGEIAALLLAEGARSPADVFWAQDAGSLGQVEAAGLFAELPPKTGARLVASFKGKSARWVPTSGRARVLAFNTKKLTTPELPRSVLFLVEDRWKGRVGWAPTNASFRAFVTAMRLKHGEQKTESWLTKMTANEAKRYPKNTPIIKALAAGEIDLGLPNHYYLLRERKANPGVHVGQSFFDDGDVGNLVNVAGAGILKGAKQPEAAARFLEFLLSEWSQRYFAEKVLEYPVVDGIKPHGDLAGLDVLGTKAPDVDLKALADLKTTRALLRKVGLL